MNAFCRMLTHAFVPSTPTRPGDAFDSNYCSDLYSCFILTVHVGLLSGGGIGEFLTFEQGFMPGTPTTPSTARLVFDIVFFACVTIGLLNIVFGIMIDTFSKLREDQQDRDNIVNNTCLICNHTRADFTSGEWSGAFWLVVRLSCQQ